MSLDFGADRQSGWKPVMAGTTFLGRISFAWYEARGMGAGDWAFEGTQV